MQFLRSRVNQENRASVHCLSYLTLHKKPPCTFIIVPNSVVRNLGRVHVGGSLTSNDIIRDYVFGCIQLVSGPDWKSRKALLTCLTPQCSSQGALFFFFFKHAQRGLLVSLVSFQEAVFQAVKEEATAFLRLGLRSHTSLTPLSVGKASHKANPE